MGFARLAEQSIRNLRGKKEGERLNAGDKILASTVGGALGTWNQPIEVVRVEVSDARTLTRGSCADCPLFPPVVRCNL
jgi:hypothetical protein